jgi:predicted nucleic acid-binding protein
LPPHEPLLTRAWEVRENVSAFEAVYVVLAASLSATLVTCDARLGSAPQIGATIDVISF